MFYPFLCLFFRLSVCLVATACVQDCGCISTVVFW